MKQTQLGLVLVLLLVAFAGIGVAHILKPDWFIKRSGVRRLLERKIRQAGRIGWRHRRMAARMVAFPDRRPALARFLVG